MNKKGFVLAETLIVVIFVLVIFTILYASVVPLLGRYEELSYYDDIDTTYDVFQYKKLLENDSNYDSITSNSFKVLSCIDFNSNDKCNTLNTVINFGSNDILLYFNGSSIDTISTGDEDLKDYLERLEVENDKKYLLLKHNGYFSYIEIGEASVPEPSVTDIESLKQRLGQDGLIAINTSGGLYDGTGSIREYRYSGGDSRWGGIVKNYITFNNEMWRIIGIFKGDTNDGSNAWNIKIMRDYPIGSYDGVDDSVQMPRDYSSTNLGEKTVAVYSESISAETSVTYTYPAFTMQEAIYNYGGTNSGNAYWGSSGIQAWLNEESNTASWYYLNYNSTNGVNKQYGNYIVTATYYTRAVDFNNNGIAAYQNERTNGIIRDYTTISRKIGLIYPSDFAYATDSTAASNWSTILTNYESIVGIKNANWILKPNNTTKDYWMLSPAADGTPYALYWSDGGYINSNGGSAYYAVRPCLYLKSSTQIKSGNGTYNNPYKIL